MKSVRYNGVTLIAFHVFEGHFSIIWPLPENITIILFINIFFSPERKHEKFHCIRNSKGVQLLVGFVTTLQLALESILEGNKMPVTPTFCVFRPISGLALKVS